MDTEWAQSRRWPVSERLNDDEKLAAFLDGRLDERERQAMLAHLAADPDAYDLLVSTADILREANEEEADVEVDGAEDESRLAHGMRSHRSETDGDAPPPVDEDGTPPEPDDGVIRLDDRRRVRVWRRLALAAVLAAVALLSARAFQSRSQSAGDPVRLAARLEQAQQGLPADWAEKSPWTTVRGGGTGESLGRGARAGALLVDLAVAVLGRDTADTRFLANRIIALYPPARSDAALRKIADGAGSPPRQLQPPLAQATAAIKKSLGDDAVRVGAWTEAARLAAARQDAAFFRDGPTTGTLERAAQLTAPQPPARDAVEQVRLLLRANPPRWGELADALDTMAGAIAIAP